MKRAHLALALIFLFGLALSGLAGYRYQTQRQALAAQAEQAAHALGEAVLEGLNRAMLKNERAEVNQILNAARDYQGITRILVLGPKGHVYVSSGEPPVGNTIPTDLPGCMECHQHSAEGLPATTTLTFLPGQLRAATSIPAPLACGSCHAQSSKNLGVILVDISLAEGEAQARAELALELALTVGGALLLCGWILWRTGALKLSAPRWMFPAWAALPVSRWFRPLALIAVALVIILLGGGLFAARLENINAFCASCHTEPETTYVQRAQSAPVDLASAHAAENIPCIECHNGAGVLGRAGAIALGARNLAAFVSGQYHRPAVLLFAMDDSACLKCHAEAMQAQTSANHYHSFLAQWKRLAPEAAGTCVACHAAHPTEGDSQRGFLNPANASPICEQCHALARAP